VAKQDRMKRHSIRVWQMQSSAIMKYEARVIADGRKPDRGGVSNPK
jgi:hypothetical protein